MPDLPFKIPPANESPSDKSPSRQSTLELGLAIIIHLNQQGGSQGVTQIANAMSLPKSSTHRLLRILCEIGFVERSETTLRYSINPHIFGFVYELARYFEHNSVFEPLLRDHAERLGLSAFAGMIGGSQAYVICAAGLEGNTSNLGTHTAAYASSIGKVLVSQLPDEKWEKYAPRADDLPFTPYTNLDPEKFYRELRHARKARIAWNLRESSIGHASVAALVERPFGRTPLAASLLIPWDRFSENDRPHYEAEAQALATELSNSLIAKSAPRPL